MDEQKNQFNFEPDRVEKAEPLEVPVEQKYNFDLFANNRGKNVDSGASNNEIRSEKRTAEARLKRETPSFRKGNTPVDDTTKNTSAAPKELPTDIFESDNATQPKKPPVKFDDDFQLDHGFKIADIGAENEKTAPNLQAKPSVRPAASRNSAAAPKRNNPINAGATGQRKRPTSEGVKESYIAEFYQANKVKVITSVVLAVIAIIAIVAIGSGMRVDIFGITNTMLIVGLLIIAVLMTVVGVFIKNKHRLLYSVLWVAIILIFASCSAGIVLSGVCDFFGISRVHKISDFTIPENGNWGTEMIAEELYNEGVINHPFLFRVYSKLKHYDGTYQWGNYELNSEMDYGSIMWALQQGNTASTVQIRIPEAATVDTIIKLFEENGVCTRDQFITAMESGDYKYTWINSIPTNKVRYRFEGYLYPDTYNFYAEPSVENAEKAIDKMLSAFNARLPKNWQELVTAVGTRIGKSDMTLNDALAIGSILELEASGNHTEMKNVASVFYNRLTWSEPHYLGSTPTYYYPDNRYNTNAGPMTVENEDGTDKTYPAGSEGIPPGPQCSVTESAILACLEPSDTNYTYFVTDIDMKFYYNKSYTAHLNTIASLRRNGKWA